MPRAAWRFNQPRQALHLQTQKLVQTLSVTWRPGVCRQAVPFPEPQNSAKRMSRLAVVHHPPGGFWRFPRNAVFQDFNSI